MIELLAENKDLVGVTIVVGFIFLALITAGAMKCTEMLITACQKWVNKLTS